MAKRFNRKTGTKTNKSKKEIRKLNKIHEIPEIVKCPECGVSIDTNEFVFKDLHGHSLQLKAGDHYECEVGENLVILCSECYIEMTPWEFKNIYGGTILIASINKKN